MEQDTPNSKSKIKNSKLLRISVAICTHNRSDLLDHSIRSVIEQSADPEAYELLVVDNASTDNTREVTEQCIDNDRGVNVRYIYESTVGLSHARNRAIDEAKADWILYLDDDAKAKEDLIEQYIDRIEKREFAVLGGPDYPWYHYGKPDWFKDRYVTAVKTHRFEYLPKGEYVIGCNMLLNRKIIKEAGGFNPDFGMKGDAVKYGEEDELQHRLRDEGHKIAYDPDLIIYHVVAPYKMKIDWHFKRHFAYGEFQVWSGSVNTSLWNLILIWCIMHAFTFVRFLVNTPKLFRTDYYIENWLIDTFRKSGKRIAIIYRALLQDREAPE